MFSSQYFVSQHLHASRTHCHEVKDLIAKTSGRPDLVLVELFEA